MNCGTRSPTTAMGRGSLPTNSKTMHTPSRGPLLCMVVKLITNRPCRVLILRRLPIWVACTLLLVTIRDAILPAEEASGSLVSLLATHSRTSINKLNRDLRRIIWAWVFHQQGVQRIWTLRVVRQTMISTMRFGIYSMTPTWTQSQSVKYADSWKRSSVWTWHHEKRWSMLLLTESCWVTHKNMFRHTSNLGFCCFLIWTFFAFIQYPPPSSCYHSFSWIWTYLMTHVAFISLISIPTFSNYIIIFGHSLYSVSLQCPLTSWSAKRTTGKSLMCFFWR